MSHQVLDPVKSLTLSRQSLREYADGGLRPDVAALGVTALAFLAAAALPGGGWFLAAFAINVWFLGRIRALVVTLGAGLVLFSLMPPQESVFRARILQDTPHFLAYIAIVALVVVATGVVRSSRKEARRHAQEMGRVNSELELQVEEVRAMSDDLTETNNALSAALTAAERSAARASALQDVTAALSVASTVSEIAEAVLTRGMRAVEASHGHLVLVEDGHIVEVLVAAETPDTTDLHDGYARVDGNLPLVEAIRERRTVWYSTTTAVSCYPPTTSRKVTGGRAMHTYLALPLTIGDEVIGGLEFDFAECPAINATDELFTSLLAHTTADALQRARAYDKEREARRSAELMSRAREEVLGVVAHDLRNPLSLVSSTSELLMDDQLAPERRKSVYDINRRAITRMNRMIGDLLDVVRLQAGHLSLNVSECDPAEVLAETMEVFQSRAWQEGISLELAPSTSVVVRADAERLLQLIDNLVGNALKFTPRGGRVSIGSQLVDGELRVFVADTGPGIPEAYRERLFDRFWQAQGTDRRGLGLGLAIAKGIAEAHGGRIWVDSMPGSGSNFQFALPISNEISAYAASTSMIA